MTRYRDDATGLDFDSRQDENGAFCPECECWIDEPFLEPCPADVDRPYKQLKEPVCNECAELLRREVEGRMAAE